MPDDEALPLQPFPALVRPAVSEKPYRKYANFALNPPERMPLPPLFEATDPIRPLRETVERLTAEQAPPEARTLPADPKLEERLEERSPQFFLRNIPRVERLLDDWLQFTVSPDPRPDQARLLDEVREARYLAPVLLDRFSVDVVRDHRDTNRRWLQGEDWTRYFSRELKEDAQGPMWRYDPNAPDGGAPLAAPAGHGGDTEDSP